MGTPQTPLHSRDTKGVYNTTVTIDNTGTQRRMSWVPVVGVSDVCCVQGAYDVLGARGVSGALWCLRCLWCLLCLRCLVVYQVPWCLMS